MTSLAFGLCAGIQALDNGPKPLPLASGFSAGHAHRSLGWYSAFETSAVSVGNRMKHNPQKALKLYHALKGHSRPAPEDLLQVSRGLRHD